MSLPRRAAGALAAGWQITAKLRELGEGLINDTFLVGADGQDDRWVLQRVNADVFEEPQLVMANVVRVVRHVRERYPGMVAGLVATADGDDFFLDTAGDCWRLWEYVADAATLQTLDNERQARSAGRMFARLQNALADLPGPRLRQPIPGFLRMSHYLAQLDALLAGTADIKGADGALAFIDARRDLAAEFADENAYVHGDCKVNNLLFRGDEACCVLDLDTVMRAHWALDLGDLVRSGADQGGRFSLPLYRALVAGFVGETQQEVDVRALLMAPRYVGLMLGVRFLADHLAGDVYFRVRDRGENLSRALVQLDLVAAMESAEDKMRDALPDLV